MIFLRTQEFSEIHKKHYKASTPIRYDVYSIPPGVYFLNIYVANTIWGEYVGYYTDNHIIISIDLHTVGIVEPIVFLENSIKTRCGFDNAYSSKPQYIIDERIKSVAKQITQGFVVNYLKVRAIHDGSPIMYFMTRIH